MLNDMISIPVPQPVEVPGEGVRNPPFPPVSARSVDASNRVSSDYWRTHRRDDARPEWSDLTPQEQVEQIRLGERSEFFDVFADDPTVFANCPECGPTVIHADGLCDDCGRDLCGPVFASMDDLRGWVA